MPEIISRRDGPIGRLVLSNPAKHNAMTADMWAALPGALRALDADPQIRVIVLEGDGDQAFVSGADISQFAAVRTEADAQARYAQTVEDAYLAPSRCGKPVIAKIRGICFGGGLGLAAACDLRFCRDDARFRMPAARLGLGYGTVGVGRFLQLLGAQATMDIFFSARVFDAADALRMGFVQCAEPPERFDRVVEDWCALAADNAPLTLRALKRTVTELARDPADRDMASVEAALAACSESEDYREGARAFMEKRRPVFQGR